MQFETGFSFARHSHVRDPAGETNSEKNTMKTDHKSAPLTRGEPQQQIIGPGFALIADGDDNLARQGGKHCLLPSSLRFQK